MVITDLNLPGAEAAAIELGPLAEAARLDVTDAEGFDALIADVFSRHGRLDWLFNNAGVGAGGLVDDLTPKDWKLVMDVNLWGVINGVSAAYPRMIAQGFGHIVNTGSGAGLAPRPGMTPYAAAKSGVVGLTMSLRAEAVAHGVKVSVACPGYVATKIIDSADYKGVDKGKLTANIPIKPMTADDCARVILKGVDRNKPIIVDSFYVWLDWMVYRIAPGFAVWLAGWRAGAFRKARTDREVGAGPEVGAGRDEARPSLVAK